MSILNQKTLKKEVKFEGVGLHTGKEVSIKVCPSKPNTGIVFKRSLEMTSNAPVFPAERDMSAFFSFNESIVFHILVSLLFLAPVNGLSSSKITSSVFIISQ